MCCQGGSSYRGWQGDLGRTPKESRLGVGVWRLAWMFWLGAERGCPRLGRRGTPRAVVPLAAVSLLAFSSGCLHWASKLTAPPWDSATEGDRTNNRKTLLENMTSLKRSKPLNTSSAIKYKHEQVISSAKGYQNHCMKLVFIILQFR